MLTILYNSLLRLASTLVALISLSSILLIPKGANLPSGLVVDTEVVDPTYPNFYLQSHDSPLGTARSAHYVIIENQSTYSMVTLQQLVSYLV